MEIVSFTFSISEWVTLGTPKKFDLKGDVTSEHPSRDDRKSFGTISVTSITSNLPAKFKKDFPCELRGGQSLSIPCEYDGTVPVGCVEGFQFLLCLSFIGSYSDD
jgi:hypothetical protein